MGGGERIGELAVPCDPKSAIRGDPLTRGGGNPTQRRPRYTNFELLPRRAGGGASPSEGRGWPPSHRTRRGSGESSRKVDA